MEKRLPGHHVPDATPEEVAAFQQAFAQTMALRAGRDRFGGAPGSLPPGPDLILANPTADHLTIGQAVTLMGNGRLIRRADWGDSIYLGHAHPEIDLVTHYIFSEGRVAERNIVTWGVLCTADLVHADWETHAGLDLR